MNDDRPRWDITYCYPESDVLINKYDVRTPELLHELETFHVAVRLSELGRNPLPGKFDLKHLQSIHRYLFQDIYEWAGDLRKINFSKYYPQLGRSEPFAPVQNLQPYLSSVFQELKGKQYLTQCKDRDQFAENCAKIMSDVNAAHPFREGNGRSQREFFRCLAMNAGFYLDWSRPSEKELTDARALSIVDHKYLAELIRDSVENEHPDRDLSDHYRSIVNDRDRDIEL